jgi:peptide chain release factor subunit 1
LYVPPSKKLSDVTGYLSEEASTADNIKSRLTRKNVTTAIGMVLSRLRLLTKIPPLGIIYFCGAIPVSGPGTEKMELYIVEPPEPFKQFIYRCSNQFELDVLEKMLEAKESWGLINITRNRSTFAVLRGDNLKILKSITSGIPGKIRAGGQSQRRFSRIIEELAHNFYVRTGENANELYLKMEGLKGLLLGGSGFTKTVFGQGDYMDYRLKEKIIAYLDLSYGGEAGIREMLQKADDHIKNVRYLDEKNLVNKFLTQISKDVSKVAYGEKQVKHALEAGAVDLLLISEGVDRLHLEIECTSCDFKEDKGLELLDLTKFETDLSSRLCPTCNNSTLIVKSQNSIIEEFGDLAEQSGSKIEIISTETEEGAQLLQGFGGIVALLRYSFS